MTHPIQSHCQVWFSLEIHSVTYVTNYRSELVSKLNKKKKLKVNFR